MSVCPERPHVGEEAAPRAGRRRYRLDVARGGERDGNFAGAGR
jgi:hypothetical protein